MTLRTKTVGSAVKPDEYELIELAARRQDSTISDFLRTTALEEARAVVIGENGEDEESEDQ